MDANAGTVRVRVPRVVVRVLTPNAALDSSKSFLEGKKYLTMSIDITLLRAAKHAP